ncbi:UNVERIFIED_CONTAM: hypothetical protein K2H54_047167 [Gekko kuhli]
MAAPQRPHLPTNLETEQLIMMAKVPLDFDSEGSQFVSVKAGSLVDSKRMVTLNHMGMGTISSEATLISVDLTATESDCGAKVQLFS